MKYKFQVDSTTTDLLRNIDLLDPIIDGRKIKSDSIWHDKLVLMLVLAPGCLFCTNGVYDILGSKEDFFDPLGVDLVAVVQEKTGAKLFATDFYDGPVFIDEHRKFDQALKYLVS